MIILLFILLVSSSIIIQPYRHYNEIIDVTFLDSVSIYIKSNLPITYRMYHNNDMEKFRKFGNNIKTFDIILNKDISYITVSISNYNLHNNTNVSLNYNRSSVIKLIIPVIISIIGLCIIFCLCYCIVILHNTRQGYEKIIDR